MSADNLSFLLKASADLDPEMQKLLEELEKDWKPGETRFYWLNRPWGTAYNKMPDGSRVVVG